MPSSAIGKICCRPIGLVCCCCLLLCRLSLFENATDLMYFIFLINTGIRTMFAGSSCYAVVTYGSMIASGHFDKKIRFWDRRQDQPANEITLMGKITSMELANGQCRFKFILSCVLNANKIFLVSFHLLSPLLPV